MLPPLATLDQLAVRVGKTAFAPGVEVDRASALLEDASALVRFEAGTDWVDPESGAALPVPDVAVTITLSAATRAWFNPAQVQSEQLGAALVRFGDVWLTGVEADRLANLGGEGDLKSVSLTPGFGFERLDAYGWAPCDYGQGQHPYADWAPIGY